MSPGTSSEVKLEIGHVLFMDIVGYSQLLITQQTEQIETLRRIVRGTAQFRAAEAEGKLLRLPTGDGGALVFRTSPEAPVLCALEISKELKKHPELKVRMGIHSGPVNAITDLNEQANIAGAGINIAQRVMDCGDAGHILLSKHVAEDLEHFPRWQPYLHELGECEVKHGVRVSIVNLYTDDAGNAALPSRLAAQKRSPVKGRQSAGFRTLLIAAIIVIGLGVPAMVFMPAILKSLRSPISGDKAASSSIPEKSVAVLPFENLSDDKQNAFFTEGGQDEVLTNLAKVADLKVRIPLFMHWPKLIKAGSAVDQFALNIDIAPTLLEIGGAPVPKEIHGRSLVPLLRGEKVSWRHSFLIEYFSDKVFPRMSKMGYQAIRDERWKYIHYVDLDGMDELYDLKTDPYEMNNLAGLSQAGDTVGQMRAKLAQLLDSSK